MYFITLYTSRTIRNKKIRELLLENMRQDELKKLLQRLTNTSIMKTTCTKKCVKYHLIKIAHQKKFYLNFLKFPNNLMKFLN